MKSGKISVNVLKRSVFKQIRAKREEVVNGAGMGADCAVFTFADGDMTVSCVQEAPVAVQEDSAFLREAAEIAQEAGGAEFSGKSGNYFAERRTMAQLIQKCANNLAAKGAEPVAVLITLLLPENTEEPDIKKLMAEADGACQELHMQIAGGQTRVTTAVKVPCGVVTGIGKISKETHHRLRGAAPGQDVVISKWIGLEGTSLLARQYGELLSERLPVYFVEEAAGFDRLLSVVPEAATAVKSGVCAMHDVSEGGIFGALWELAEGAGVGLTIDLKKLPLRQETVEVCECCNVNPYELLSGGCLLMTCEDGSALVSALRTEGIAAVTVGKVTDSNDRILVNEDEVRYLDRPKVDQIYGG